MSVDGDDNRRFETAYVLPLEDEKLNQAVNLFNLHRDYVKNEDANIHNRMSWFIQLQSFCIAASALIVGSSFNAIVNTPILNITLVAMLAAASLVQLSICAVGRQSAASSRKIVDLAVAAVYEVRHRGNALLYHWIDAGVLPSVTDGLSVDWRVKRHEDKTAGKDKTPIMIIIPELMERLWISFAIILMVVWGIFLFHQNSLGVASVLASPW